MESKAVKLIIYINNKLKNVFFFTFFFSSLKDQQLPKHSPKLKMLYKFIINYMTSKVETNKW